MQTEYALTSTHARALSALDVPGASVRRVARRLRAIVRLLARRRRMRRRYDDLRHLDDRTLRDLGVSRSELGSVVAELGGQVAATRRRTDFADATSASARVLIRSAG